MQNQKSELWTKLELCIRRLLDNPSIMHDKKLDYELGMNIEEINSLAGTEIFRVETTDIETFLIIRNPKLSEEFAERWCVHSKGWGCVFDHPNTKRDKFNRTIECLRAWQSEFTQEGALSDVSTGKPTVGKNDGKMENRQQILELARQMREEIVQQTMSHQYKFKLACETFSEAIDKGAFKGAFFFQLRRIMDLEQYPSTGRTTRYGMIFSLAVDWIKGRPELFSFTLPKFHGGTVCGGTVQDYGEEIKAHRVPTGFYAINIPAVGIVIALQCEAELKNGSQISNDIGGADNDESDTPKAIPKNNNKKYRFDGEALDCANAYKEMIDSGDYQSVKTFCIDYGTEHKKSSSTLEKKLSQNRTEWDENGKYFRCKPK